jgi:hypothetical protein
MWTTNKMAQLYDLIAKQKVNYRVAGSRLGAPPSACRNKFKRTDWKDFNRLRKNPTPTFVSPMKRGKWSDEDKIRLHSMRTESRPPLSYLEIAKKLNRTLTACERRFQETNWKKFFETLNQPKQPTNSEQEIALLPPKELSASLATWLLEMSRWNIARLEEITSYDFMKKVNLTEARMPCPFSKLKDMAKKELGAMGYNYPEELTFSKGTYIIIGDSHGKHTKRGVFALLKTLSRHIKANKIIHIGHALDDDSDMSYCWEDIDNLVVLSRREELQRLMDLNFPYEIARDRIHLGRLSLFNQDFITDYSQSFIGVLRRNHFEDSTIVNLHRQELVTRCTGGGEHVRVQIASPGCLCEPHITKTIKQIDFAEGRQVKVSYPDAHVRYHKMDDFAKRNWEQGLIIVRVDENGRYDFIQCRIYKTSKGYTTSYFDKIITETGVISPEKKLFFTGDAHCYNHDTAILDIQERFCKDYKPDSVVNLGDVINNRACNHHLMERNGFAISTDVLDEMASAHYILKRMKSWGKECHLLCGNHERFARDISEKFPQFASIFSVPFMVGTNRLGYKLTTFKKVLQIGDVQFNHGDMIMFGSRGGNKLEKAFNTFGRNTVIGHLHSPTIRNGCYMVGLSGNMDQEYNEPEASSWMHGFGYVNIFEDKAFVSLVNIRDHMTWINGHYYVAKDENSWLLPDYEANIEFSFR